MTRSPTILSLVATSVSVRQALTAATALVIVGFPSGDLLAQSSYQRLLKQVGALEASCDHTGVSELLATAREQFPEETDVWYRTTLEAVSTNDFADAAHASSVANALAPFSPEAVAAQGIFAGAFGDPETATGAKERLSLLCLKGCEDMHDVLDTVIETGGYSGANQTVSPSKLSRAQVVSMQESLNLKGHDAGIADGIYGRGTRGALLSYLRENEGGGDLTCASFDRLLAPIPTSAPQPAPEPSQASAPQQ